MVREDEKIASSQQCSPAAAQEQSGAAKHASKSGNSGIVPPARRTGGSGAWSLQKLILEGKALEILRRSVPPRLSQALFTIGVLVGVQLYLHGAWHAAAAGGGGLEGAIGERLRGLEMRLRQREAELASIKSHVASLRPRPNGLTASPLTTAGPAATDSAFNGTQSAGATGRRDPCRLHWGSGEGAGMGLGAGTGAAGSDTGQGWGNASAAAQRPLLYVGVLTRPTARDKRDAVRETWFRHGNGEWVGVFFLGKPKGDPALAAALEEEAARECDIEFVREEEDYYAIAYKRAAASPVQSLAVLERGSLQARAHFVLKTDDDSFVYMWQLLRELRAAPRRGFFWGYNIGDFKPNRDSKSQWFMPFEEWSESEPHMPVLSGAGYVLSADMAAFAARESHKPTARIRRLEDVAVAALLRSAPTYGGAPKHDNRVRHLGQCTDDSLILHYRKPEKMRSIERDLRALGYPYPTCAQCDEGTDLNLSPPPPPSAAGADGSKGKLRGAHHHVRFRVPNACIRREQTVCKVDEIRTVPGGGEVRARGC